MSIAAESGILNSKENTKMEIDESSEVQTANRSDSVPKKSAASKPTRARGGSSASETASEKGVLQPTESGDEDDSETGDSSETLYCFCRQPSDSKFMIACDGCHEW
jgi:hypothetical protein